MHQALGVLRDYYFPCAIEAACTYEMTLASGEVRTVVTQDAGASYLVLSVTPKKASVYVDGGMLDGDGSGDYMVALPYGEHQYRVEAGGYMPEAGVVQIGKEKSVLNISLKSALATLTIATTTAGTEIFVNDKRMGTGSWSGSLGAGTYILEGRLAGYRSQKTSVTLAKQDEKSVTLPALEAMYGMLNVSYKPVGAEVWVDGKKLGTSPDIFNNVLVGTHKVEIKKDGHVPYSESVTIAEGETKEFAGALNEIKYSDFQGKVPAAGTEARTMYDKAITGDADAQNKLGYWYETSEKDMASAVYWYRKSAELGYAKAQYNLGMCYYYGQGVSKDISKALKWWRRAAEQGLVDAQYNLATHISYYGDGDDVDKSIKEAVNWYRKAAEQGHIGAQCSLGECYEDGCGVSKDVSEAVKLYRKAAEQGEAWAQNRLGEIYYYGKGVSKDYYEAVKWYRKAAEQGEYWAQYGLGECYENGLGVGKDINEAVKWYRKAAEQGIGIAKKRLKDLGY